MKTNLKNRNFIETADWSKEELESVLSAAENLKLHFGMKMPYKLLENKTLFMMFFEQSIQTCNSASAAMTQLGGHAHYYAPSRMETDHGQTPKDTGKILSRYGHGIAIKNCCYGVGNKYIKEVAHFSQIPVLNLQCDVDHPCQSTSDIMTIREKLGENLKGAKIAISWAYAKGIARPASVPQGLITLMPRFGLDVVIAHPKEFKLMPKTVETAQKFAKGQGTSFQMTDNMDDAFKDADIVYPYFWGCHEYLCEEGVAECDRPKFCDGMLDKYKHWICSQNKMKLAKKNALYMHPMPAERGFEVEEQVIDSEQSVVYDQAENRLHIMKALCALTMGGFL